MCSRVVSTAQRGKLGRLAPVLACIVSLLLWHTQLRKKWLTASSSMHSFHYLHGIHVHMVEDL
jgi:hypothetical protein